MEGRSSQIHEQPLGDNTRNAHWLWASGRLRSVGRLSSLAGHRAVLEQKCVTVRETGDFGQLEVENLSEHFDLYIQAGDVVKGGRQARTLGVDFVLPAKSGRVPIPSFCVESGHWHRRAAEDAGSFSSSKTYLSSKALRMARRSSAF